MAEKQDVLLAKQAVSSSLLRAGSRGGVVRRSATFRVAAAVEHARQNVHAVGVGRKVVNGKETSELCVRVYVVQKLAESLLPPAFRVPEQIDGVPTDIIESAPAFLLARKSRTSKPPKNATSAAPACSDNRRKRQRPLVAGISAGHFQITAGTIGYFCRSTRHGDSPADKFLLSNNHVFADVNNGHPGDDILQPGAADGGVAADRVADLTRFVPIRLGGSLPNRVDAAIARIVPGVAHNVELCSIGPITGTAKATEGTLVRKHGRTTGYTEGKVTDESYDALVGMDHNDPDVVALFEDQLRIERTPPHATIGLGGDSGSLVVARDSAVAVGLYFAGPPSGFYGIANHIQDVLTELEIQLL